MRPDPRVALWGVRLAIMLGVVWAGPAAAQPVVAATEGAMPEALCGGEFVELYIDKNGIPSCQILVSTGSATSFHLAGNIIDDDVTEEQQEVFYFKRQRDFALVLPRSDLTPGTVGHIGIVTEQFRTVLHVRVTDDRYFEAARSVMVRHVDELLPKNREQSERRVLQQIARSVEVEPAPAFRGRPAVLSQDAAIVGTRQISAATKLESSRVYVVFEVYNGGFAPLVVTGVELVASGGPEDETINRVKRVEMVSSGITTPSRLATVPSWSRAKGAILLDSPESVTETMTLRIHVAGQATPLTAQLQGYELIPIRKPPPPDPYEGRKELGAAAFFGGVWLVSPLDITRTDPTRILGAGARMAYYFNSIIGVETDLAFAATGKASFADVEYGGEVGDLSRSATLGRVRVGGLVRVGKGELVPTLRLGVGVQGAGHTTAFTVAGAERPAPEVGFEADILWYFGAGLDVPFGSFVVSFGLSANEMMNSPSRTVEAGMHLGYFWQ